ncbi:Imm1 family immunity protein [Saccharopolyspora sp. CA-218241]|uniref:Imm1 family immunity protein n=1 Tax=Saccharopolyspora sp. CA-218241 TaxID=3240027 RepID=UPI003D96A44C
MTATGTATVVTVVFHHIYRYARTPREIAALIDQIVEAPLDPMVHVTVWDRPCLSHRDPGGPAAPAVRLRVSSYPGTGWGALNWADARPGAAGGELVDSFNPDADERTPPLLFDEEGDLWFPASASLPLDRVRQAVAEYCGTGLRPACVGWQPGCWY